MENGRRRTKGLSILALATIVVAGSISVIPAFPRATDRTEGRCTELLDCYPVLFIESGLPTNSSWQVSLAGQVESSQGTTILFWTPKGHFSYIVSDSSQGGPNERSGTITVDSSNPISVSRTIDLGSTLAKNGKAPDPAGIAFDPRNGYIYVASPELNTLMIINGSSIIGSIRFNSTTVINGFNITATPYELAYNPVNGYMYMTAANSSMVYVINGTNLVSTVPLITPGALSNVTSSVTNGSYGLSFDPANGYVYVTQPLAHSVAVIDNLQVTTTISLGNNAYPANIAYDPSNAELFITDFESNKITAIKDFSVVGSVYIGNCSSSYGVTYIPSETTMLATIPKSGVVFFNNLTGAGSKVDIPEAWTASYDQGNRLVYVAAGYGESDNSVYVVNGSRIIMKIVVGTEPWASAYDPLTGYMYTTNHGSSSISMISSGILVAIHFSSHG